MSRRLPRSFFWIDQNVIRSGAWLRLSAEARLAYISIAASCDREGLSIWSVPKLMALSGCLERENWNERVSELESHQLIDRVPEHSPPALRIRELEGSHREVPDKSETLRPSSSPHTGSCVAPQPIIVHTQTTIHLGGKNTDAES